MSSQKPQNTGYGKPLVIRHAYSHLIQLSSQLVVARLYLLVFKGRASGSQGCLMGSSGPTYPELW